jgi:hypothetical protein
VLEVAQEFAESLLLLVVQFILDADLRRRELRAADLDRGGEDLGVVLLADAGGEARCGSVVAVPGRAKRDWPWSGGKRCKRLRPREL